MKKLFIVLFLLIFLVVAGAVGGAVYAIANANSIAKQYKPDLEKLASDALGSKVTFGGISAKIYPTARLAISQAQVESGGEKMTLDSLSLNVELLPLLQRDLIVKELVLDSPKITVYLEKDGFFIAGLPRKRPADAKTAKASPAAGGSSATPLSVTLQYVSLKNATIALVDKTVNKTYVVKSLRAKAGISYDSGVVRLSTLDGGMTILDKVDTTFGGKDATMHLEGGAFEIKEATAKALGNSFKVTGGIDPADRKKALRITSDRVDLNSLGPFYDVFAPGINELGIKGLCKPDITVAWTPEGAYRANGMIGISEASWKVADIPLTQMQGTLNLDATDKGAKVTTKDTKGLLRKSPFTLAVDSGLKDKRAGLETVTAKVFDGTGTLKTDINLEGDMPFTSKLSLTDMKIEQALPALMPDNTSNISGTIKEMSGDIKGTFNDKLMASITGTAKMHLADGLIKDVNLGKEVLGGVTEIPFVQGTLLKAVPAGMQDLVTKPHTALESVTATYTIANQQLKTEDLHIQSDYFTLDGKGTIGFDTKLDLVAMIYFNKDFSGGLATMVKEIGVLFDNQGRLAFPVKVKGIPPKLSVMPDVGDLVKRATTGVVKQEVQKQLDKAVGGQAGGIVNKLLGGDKKTPATAPDAGAAPAPGATPPPAQTPAPDAPKDDVKKTVEKAVGGLLKGIGGKKP